MRAFCALIRALDQTNRTLDKVAALREYFAGAPPHDAAWALWVLSGQRVKRAAPTTDLRAWIGELSGLPEWLVEESYGVVGDLAETLALLHPVPGPDGGPDPDTGPGLALHEVMEQRVVPLRELDASARRASIEQTWRELGPWERFVFNKLLTGAFRLGVGRRLAVRGLSEATGIDPLRLAHRLTGPWHPSPAEFERIINPDPDAVDPGRPYPFFLAHPVDEQQPLDESLGPASDWIAEWKWDGIRAQVIRRAGETLIWSRGEELVTKQFPEIVESAGQLPDGVVLDGEVLAWRDGVLPFADLQRRLNRKRVGAKLMGEVPVRFLAYDLLEAGGEDLRGLPIEQRQSRLVALLEAHPEVGDRLARSEPVEPASPEPRWDDLAELRSEARDRGVEGLMLKRRGSPYRQGRPRGDWFKWKVDPLRLDGVLLYAQRGHGRRAALYSDYTFGVWSGDELVPIAKAYSGLRDAEIREVDRWIRRHTIERFGPVRAVEPELVFELEFDGLRRSSRHRSGIALRFPRMARRRTDKPAHEADTLERVQALLDEPQPDPSPQRQPEPNQERQPEPGQEHRRGGQAHRGANT